MPGQKNNVLCEFCFVFLSERSLLGGAEKTGEGGGRKKQLAEETKGSGGAAGGTVEGLCHPQARINVKELHGRPVPGHISCI